MESERLGTMRDTALFLKRLIRPRMKFYTQRRYNVTDYKEKALNHT